VLLTKRHPNTIAEQVAPRNAYFGVMLPYTPLHYLLMTHGFTALVMTSGNMSEEPIAIGNEDAFQRLADIADYFLVHDRDIYLRSDDSIVRHLADETRVIRRSRGYVPRPIFLKQALPRILACGAELKNTICLTRDNQAFLSQHIGDLENVATNDFFKLTVKHLQRILDITPEAIAYDLHPDYLSTVYAKQRTDLVQIPVQHHHAHIASCMAEHHLEGRVMGLAFDGTGYGSDGKVWGGEVLIADSAAFIRAAHWRYVAMPGSTAAIKEPWRMAVSYLFDAYGEEARALQLPLWERLDAGNVRIISEMITKNINAPMTSSLGRLFDGLAAILGIRDTVVFEGQAAMELEMVADTDTQAVYDYAWENGSPVQILPQPIIVGVIDDMRKGTPVPVISGKFHQTLIRLFTDLAQHLRTEYDVNRVVLSGGSFQNAILLQGFITELRQQGFEVFAQQQVPTNDGGIALGQAVVAAAKLKS
jgi:hydrogenase maturation protein HypF